MQNEQKSVQALKAHLALNVKDVEASLGVLSKTFGNRTQQGANGLRKIRRSESTVESNAQSARF